MKARFYECIKKLAVEHNIQYIFTAIQDDLIRDKNGKIVDHPELHIALKLHDEGSEGKLFLMDY